MLKIAIIGLGAVTRNIHMPAYRELRNDLRVVAGCDPDTEARRRATEEWGIPAVFKSPQEMFRATAPDIVSVCTPPSLHKRHVLLALALGCHVFCEKPFAYTMEQADEMIRVADTRRRHLVINNQFPSMNAHRAAKKLIGSPEFGRLLFLQASQIFHPSPTTETGWRGELRRRLCFEFGTHVFELIRFFFDDTPVRLTAHMPRPLPDARCDVLNIVTAEFRDGRAANVVLNRLSKGPPHYLDMRLDGETASIHTSIGGQLEFKAGLHASTRRPFAGFSFVQGGRAVLQNGARSVTLEKDGLNPFASATARHFRGLLEAIEQGGVPRGNAADNRKTLAMALAAYDSAESGQPIDLEAYLEGRRAVQPPRAMATAAGM